MLEFRKHLLYKYVMTDAIADQSAPKRAILDLLKRNGPSEASVLAEALGVTAMAVRQHLYALEAALLQLGEFLAVFAFAPPDHRR